MKSRALGVVCVVLLALFMSGCASVYRVALSPTASAQLKSADTSGVVAIEKDEIGSSIHASNMTAAAGGGLLFALADTLINRSQAKKAEADLADIRNALLNHTFDEALTNAFSQRFSHGGAGAGVSLSTVIVSKSTSAREIGRLVEEAKSDAVAVVFVRHIMSPEYKNVVLLTEAVLCAKSDALRQIAETVSYAGQKVPVLYRNHIQSRWPIVAADMPARPRSEEILAAWAKDDGAKVRAALNDAAREIADVVYWDLGEPAREDYSKDPPGGPARSVRAYDYAGSTPEPRSGKIYRRENNRAWVRTANGCIYAQPE